MNHSIFSRSSHILAATCSAALLCLPVAAVAETAPVPQRTVAAPAKPKLQSAASPAPTAQTPATQGLASGKTPEVVARVGNTNISAEEMRAYIGALAPRDQAALAKDPAQLSQVVRMLLANRLVLQEVTSKKWDQQPAIAAQLDRVHENAVVELYLQAVASPPESYPGEDELQKTYEANRAQLLVPRQFQLAQIFVAVPKEADKQAEDKAKKSLDEILAKLKAPGADFAALSRTEGDSKEAAELGWVPETQIRPEIRAQVIGLTKNSVSEPVRLDDGWHILKLVDTKAAYTRTLPEVRDQIVQQMRSERTNQMRRAYLADVLKQNPPILNELALSSLLDSSSK